MAKNIFVSIPMNGKTEEEQWEEVLDTARKYVDSHPGEEVYFFDNRYLDQEAIRKLPCKEGNENLLYLSYALQQMAICDDVIFHEDWEHARGCKVEKLVYDLYFKNGS